MILLSQERESTKVEQWAKNGVWSDLKYSRDLRCLFIKAGLFYHFCHVQKQLRNPLILGNKQALLFCLEMSPLFHCDKSNKNLHRDS